VAEETLGIALYCSLKYQNDFSSGLIAAVNHKGDSDSTGAVTGNILGALTGYDAMDEKWKQHLEIRDVILEIADDLCHGCQMNEFGQYEDPEWVSKYINMRRAGSETPDEADMPETDGEAEESEPEEDGESEESEPKEEGLFRHLISSIRQSLTGSDEE